MSLLYTASYHNYKPNEENYTMTMPTKAQIFEHWMDWLDKRGFDWGEPCCWACKRDLDDRYDLNKPSATREEIIKN